MADISYDTLTIQINADSKVATKNINALNRGLKNLDNTAKDLDTAKIIEVKGLLLDIANIDFSNISQGLRDLVSAFKSFQNKAFMKATIGGTNLSGVRQAKTPTYDGTQLPRFDAFPKADYEGFNKFVDSLKEGFHYTQKIVDGFSEVVVLADETTNPLEILGQKLEKIGLDGKQMEVVFNGVKNAVNTISKEQLAELEKVLKDIGLEAKDVQKILKKLGQEGEKSGKKASGGIQQLALQFKNILKYRVVRKLIQEIFQNISEAITELAYVDDGFNQSLGEIVSAFSYIGRTLVSVIAPVIKAIAPIITSLAEGLGGVATIIGGALAGVLGQDEFAEATESVETYTESLEKAKSVATGFDKLNVISQNNNDGNFQMKQVEATGRLGEIINKLNESLQPIYKALQSFVKKIQPLLEVVLDIVGQILDETMYDVNNSIAMTIEMLGSILEVVGLLLKTLKPILSVLTSIGDLGLNAINTLITLLANITTNVLEPLIPLLTLIADILDFLSPVLMMISEVFKSLTGSTDNVIGRIIGGILTGGVSELLRLLKGGFATGGFPENGIFFANDNELVGRFDNGRTAVANNEQITQGIYQAVLQAMRESGGNNVVINLDGKKIAEVVNKQNANMGSRFLMGGVINYGK